MSLPIHSNVQKVLFPSTSEENLNAEQEDDKFLKELQEKSEEAKAKWNFDFVNEVPLDGNYEWEAIRVPEVIPKKADELKAKLTPQNERQLWSKKRQVIFTNILITLQLFIYFILCDYIWVVRYIYINKVWFNLFKRGLIQCKRFFAKSAFLPVFKRRLFT